MAQKKIKEQAEAYGRDPSSIEWGVSISTLLGNTTDEALQQAAELGVDKAHLEQSHAIGSPQDCVDTIKRYADLGITQFILTSRSLPADRISQYEKIATNVLPHFRDAV